MFKSVLGWFEESLEGDEIRFKIDIRNQKGGLARERPEEVQRGDGDRWGTVGGVHGWTVGEWEEGTGRGERKQGAADSVLEIWAATYQQRPIRLQPMSAQESCRVSVRWVLAN